MGENQNVKIYIRIGNMWVEIVNEKDTFAKTTNVYAKKDNYNPTI